MFFNNLSQNRLRTRSGRTADQTHYDKARRLTVLTNENGETYRLDYDPTDNLIQETGWDGKITAYGYDAAGQLVQQTEYGQSIDKGRDLCKIPQNPLNSY